MPSLFGNVRSNYFRLFFHYMYFDVAKWSYVQFGVLIPYIALGTAITIGTGALVYHWRLRPRPPDDPGVETY